MRKKFSPFLLYKKVSFDLRKPSFFAYSLFQMDVGNDLIDPPKSKAHLLSSVISQLLSFAPWRRLPFPSRKMHNPIWTWQEREGQQLETRRLLCYWRVAGVAVEASTSIPWECKFDGFLPFNIFLSLNAFFNFYPASQFSRIIWKKSHLNFRAKIYYCSCIYKSPFLARKIIPFWMDKS